MLSEEQREAWEQEKRALALTFKSAKEAAVAAVHSGAAVPEWAAERLKTSFREENWWTDPVQEGWVVYEGEIPPVVDGIGQYYFDGCLKPEREKELLAGAVPTNDEQIRHRERFLVDVFENAQNHDNWLTYWQIFEVRADAGTCYLLIANNSLGQGGLDIIVFQFFVAADDALNWLRHGAIIEQDFLRWRTKRTGS